MEWLRGLFNKKKASPFFIKIKRFVLEEMSLNDIKAIYYLGACENTAANYKNIISYLTINGSRLFITSYNTQSDNLEIFLVEKADGVLMAFVMLDPVELYQTEEVLGIFRLKSYPIRDFLSKQIYP